MKNFDWNEHAKHVGALRAMGCAVVSITPEDIQTLTCDDETDEFTITDDQAEEWMSLHYDYIEEAILGDYWGDTIRAIIEHKPIGSPKEPFAVRVGTAGDSEGRVGAERFPSYDDAEQFANAIRKPGFWASVEQLALEEQHA